MPTTRSSSASASMLSSPFKAVTLDSSPLVSPSTISKPPVTPKRVFKAVSAQTESENGVLASTRTPRTPKTPKGKSSLTEPLDTPSPSKKRKTAAPLFPPRNLIPNPGSSLIPAKLGFSLLQAKSHTISCDPRFSRVFEKIPCRPFEDLQPVDAFRALCTSIIGQQVSWLAARAINHRFRRLFFPNLPEKAVEKGSEMWTKDSDYPTPEQVLSKSVEELRSVGFSGRKVEYGESPLHSTIILCYPKGISPKWTTVYRQLLQSKASPNISSTVVSPPPSSKPHQSKKSLKPSSMSEE